MRNAGIPIPTADSSASPTSPKVARTPKAITIARSPTFRRSRDVIPRVSATNSGAAPPGR